MQIQKIYWDLDEFWEYCKVKNFVNIQVQSVHHETVKVVFDGQFQQKMLMFENSIKSFKNNGLSAFQRMKLETNRICGY